MTTRLLEDVTPTVLDPSKGRDPAHLPSLRQAQRPCGRAAETASRMEELATRISVAASLSPRDVMSAANGTAPSLSRRRDATQRTSRRLDKLSDRMAEPSETASRMKELATRISVAASLSPRDVMSAENGSARSLSPSKGRNAPRAASTSSATVWPSYQDRSPLRAAGHWHRKPLRGAGRPHHRRCCS